MGQKEPTDENSYRNAIYKMLDNIIEEDKLKRIYKLVLYIYIKKVD